MIVTYYYFSGVRCKTCDTFMCLNEYETTVEFTPTKAVLSDAVFLHCHKCGSVNIYLGDCLVSSSSRHTMVPLQPSSLLPR